MQLGAPFLLLLQMTVLLNEVASRLHDLNDNNSYRLVSL